MFPVHPFVALAYLVVMIVISGLSVGVATALLNIWIKRRWHTGIFRNLAIGWLVGGTCLVAIVFGVGNLRWFNGQPMNISTSIWDNAGKISLFVSLIATVIVHLSAARYSRLNTQ